MKFLKEVSEALGHLAFPHVCESCGSDMVQQDHFLCLPCLSSMPETRFQFHAANPVEKLFWGRLPLVSATAQYYFTKESMMQRLMHGIKYRGNRPLAIYLGRLMGAALIDCNRFADVDMLVPLPLHAAKEKRRGYNQAALLCEGMSEVMNIPVIKNAVIRINNTESQTRKSRLQRWLNMEGKFELNHAELLQNKHVLLVDDVVTTGATLEACGRAILEASAVRVSVATLCFSSH